MRSKNFHLSWPHLILSVIGLALSAYAWHEHLLIKAHQESSCYVNATFNCDDVMGSKYGELFHVPLGVFGVVFFAIVLLTAFSTEPEFSPRRFRQTQLAVATVGIGTSVVLLYISKVLIGVFCPICMATHVTTTLLFIFSLLAFLRAKANADAVNPKL